MPATLQDQRDPINILYYGDGGTGKTTDAATMADLGPVVIVNAESGVKKRPLKQFGIAVENIQIFPGPGERIDFDGLEAEYYRIAEALDKKPDAYAGVVWDSITEIHKALLDTVVTAAVARQERAGKQRDRHFIALEDYGVMTEQMRNLVRKYRDLPCHFALTALARREQDDDGSVTYQPAVTPKLQLDLVGWVDIVCHTSVAIVDGEEEFRGLFRPHGKFRGKDRLRALPKWLVEPTFSRVEAYVEGELTVEEDPVQIEAQERHARARAQEARGNPSENETDKEN